MNKTGTLGTGSKEGMTFWASGCESSRGSLLERRIEMVKSLEVFEGIVSSLESYTRAHRDAAEQYAGNLNEISTRLEKLMEVVAKEKGE